MATAPTIVQKASSAATLTHGTSTSVSLTGVTAGNSLLMIAGHVPSSGSNGATVNSVVDSAGQTWSAIATQVSANAPYALGITAWMLSSANAGTHSLTVGFSDDYAWVELIELTPSIVDQVGVVAGAGVSTTSITVSAPSTTVADELWIAAFATVDQVGGTTAMGITDPPSGWTSDVVWQNESVQSPVGEVCHKTVSATGTPSVAWSWTNGGASAALVIAVSAPPQRPTITAQPTQQSVAVGAAATFTTAATASAGALSYQWYRAPATSLYSNVPGAWSAISGATGASYTTGALSGSNNGDWYYCAVTDSNGTIKTASARVFLLGSGDSGKGRTGGSLGLTAYAARRRSLGGQVVELYRKGTPSADTSAAAAAWADWLGVALSSSNPTIGAGVGAVAFSAPAAGISQLISSAPASVSAVGISASTSQIIAASAGTATAQGVGAALAQLIAAQPATAGWIGVAASLPTLIAAQVGSATASGVAGSVSQLIAAMPAAWSVGGVAATVSQLVSAAPGGVTWSASAAGVSQLIGAAPASLAWSGVAVSTTAPLIASPASVVWSGAPASLFVVLGAQPAVASWSGQPASATQLIKSSPALASASGVSCGMSSLVAAQPALAAWGGVTAGLSQLVSATVGVASFGCVAAWIPGALAVAPAAVTWTGAPAGLSQLLAAMPGVASASGVNCSTHALIAAQPGAVAAEGVAASTSMLIGAAPGAYEWMSPSAGMSLLIAAVPAVAAWRGVTARLASDLRDGGTWVAPALPRVYLAGDLITVPVRVTNWIALPQARNWIES